MAAEATRLLVTSVLCSALAHAAVGGALVIRPLSPRLPASNHVQMTFAAPMPGPSPRAERSAPAPPHVETKEETPELPKPTRPLAAQPQREVSAREPEQETTREPEQETTETEAPTADKAEADALDLTGVTLTASEGAFSVPRGSGAPRRSPLKNSGRKVAPAKRAAAGPPPRPRQQLRIVPLAELSRKPVAPALDATLRARYPAAAKAQGLSGDARVRVRIGPDGVARGAQVVFESGPGFGQACRATVEGSRWGAPRDSSGRAVATTIAYRCRFRVRP